MFNVYNKKDLQVSDYENSRYFEHNGLIFLAERDSPQSTKNKVLYSYDTVIHDSTGIKSITFKENGKVTMFSKDKVQIIDTISSNITLCKVDKFLVALATSWLFEQIASQNVKVLCQFTVIADAPSTLKGKLIGITSYTVRNRSTWELMKKLYNEENIVYSLMNEKSDNPTLDGTVGAQFCNILEENKPFLAFKSGRFFVITNKQVNYFKTMKEAEQFISLRKV